jgi:subtilase family serine protease
MLKRLALLECLLILCGGVARAQERRRIPGPIDENRRVVLPGTVHPRARTQFDMGPLDPSRRIGPLIVLLKRSSERQAAVEKLLEDQRDPASPNFHKWLTPEQYADQFGLGDDVLSAVRQWIESHGLTIDHAARGRNWIGFSGSAAQVEAALGTGIHRYRIGAEEHYANASEVSIPAALAPVVGAFAGLNDFNPKPLFTTGNGTHFLAPDDLAVIYDLAPLYGSGIDGTGQKIVIVGDSQLEPNLADIHAFRNRFHLPGSDPQVVLYGTDP